MSFASAQQLLLSCLWMVFIRLGITTEPSNRSNEAMKTQWKNRRGLIKYGIAYLLGVPVTLLVIIFIISRGCS